MPKKTFIDNYYERRLTMLKLLLLDQVEYGARVEYKDVNDFDRIYYHDGEAILGMRTNKNEGVDTFYVKPTPERRS